MNEATADFLTPEKVESAVDVFDAIHNTVNTIIDRALQQDGECRECMLQAACTIAQAAIDMDSNVGQ